jgi:NH3-dependent NAD+ synthetase
MKAQYSIAGMTKGVVVGTDHAAEAIATGHHRVRRRRHRH